MNLVLRAVPESDYPAYAVLMNDPLISQTSRSVPYPVPAGYVTSRLNESAASERTDGRTIVRGIYVDDQLVGGGTFFTNDDDLPEIGYFIGAEFRGKGYASRAATALVRLLRLFNYFGPVAAHHGVGNDQSARILAKLGFKKGEEVELSSDLRAQSVSLCRWLLPAEVDPNPVSLRPLAAADIPSLFMLQNDREAAEMAGAGEMIEESVFEKRMQTMIQRDPNDAAMYTVLVKGEIAGYLAYTRHASGKLQTSSWFFRAFWGGGVATRARTLFLQALPETVRKEGLYAAVVGNNVASRRVLEKSGYMKIREVEFYSEPHGKTLQQALYRW